MRSFNKRHIFLFVKIALALIIVFMLLKGGQLDFRSISVVFQSLNLFIPALFCLFAGILISGFRWWFLLRATDNYIPLLTILKLQLVGSFFSTWLPGAAGGDAVKGVQIYRLLKNGRSTAILSIVTDRIFAMLGLISIAAIVSFYLPTAISPESAIFKYVTLLKLFSLSIVVGVVFSILCVFLILRYSLIDHLPAKLRHYLHPFGVTILLYFRAWPILVFCGVISIVATGIVIMGMVIIASIFSYAPNAEITAIAGVFGNLSSVIPITPGGLGVGESVFSRICSDLSATVAPFATIYFSFRVGMLIVNVPGMIVSIFYSTERHRQHVDSLTEK
jgi:uncharacterized protein (TIRG00374 family)